MSNWASDRQFYDQLCLRKHGDEVEQYGAENYDLDQRLPNYERFWRNHVAPATERPAAIDLRDGIAPSMKALALRSYETFNHLVGACDFLAMAQRGDLGGRQKHGWLNFLTCCGNAIGAFAGLREAAKGVQAAAAWPARNGVGRDPEVGWRERERAIVAYRTYLATLGVQQPRVVETSEGSKLAFVLRDDLIVMTPASTWDQSARSFGTTQGAWITLADACEKHLADMLGWLNDGYAQLLERLEPLLVCPAYHRLWGWHGTG